MQETKLCLKIINQNNIFEINSFYFKIIGIYSSMIWESYYLIFKKINSKKIGSKIGNQFSINQSAASTSPAFTPTLNSRYLRPTSHKY